MPALHDLQSGFRRLMVAGDAGDLADKVISDRIAAAARLQVYRNHYRITLAEALAATFPAVQRLVGDDFFGGLARAYITEHPPAAPCLFEYGATFADFIAAFPPCRDLPYLADVARFEWAINAAWHADDAPALSADALATVAPERRDGLHLRLHRSVTLLESRWPVLRLWRATRGDGNEAVDLDAGGDCLLIWRKVADVLWRRVGADEWPFWRGLASGRHLADAAAVLAADFDFTRLLAAALNDGLFGDSSCLS